MTTRHRYVWALYQMPLYGRSIILNNDDETISKLQRGTFTFESDRAMQRSKKREGVEEQALSKIGKATAPASNGDLNLSNWGPFLAEMGT